MRILNALLIVSMCAVLLAGAPIAGGMSCAPVEAHASTEAASRAGKPFFFISGMVTMPVATIFETTIPETDPNKLDAVIEILAEPPR